MSSSRQGHTYGGIDVSGGISHFGDVYQSSAPPEPLPTPSSTILPRSDENFVDRDHLLQQLHDKAKKESAWVALVGLGGAGKTQLAIRYVRGVRERGDIWILWLFAANASRFDESLRDVAEQIRLPGRQNAKADILNLYQTWLADATRRWIVVLDNVDDAKFLLESPPTEATKRRIDYIPSCSHGAVIITSRSKDAAHNFVDEDNVIDVKPMNLAVALALLQKKLGSLYEQDNAAKLATALDFMPLAISQAASYIKQKRKYSIERYLRELEESRHLRTSLLRQHGQVPKRDREASSSIILTWQISFEYIHNERKSAADLLALMSFCDRQAIPEFLLHDDRDQPMSEDGRSDYKDLSRDQDTFDDDLQMLENFSFISTTANATTWDMHRLVQDAMQWWLLDHDRGEDMKRRYVSRLSETMPGGDYENWKTWEVLLPHGETGVSDISDEREVALKQADILYRMAWYAKQRGLTTDAISNAEKSLMIRSKWPGVQDLDLISSMDMLGSTYRTHGRYEEAEQLLVKALEISMRVLGKEHLETLAITQDLALTYSDQGRYDDAEELQFQGLEITMRVIGKEHRDTMTSIANLGLTYKYQGRYEDAEELQAKALEIAERVLGEKHPETLSAMSNLAMTYNVQGRYEDAEVLDRKALEVRTRVLGEEHPDTLVSMNNLALTYYKQGRLLEALNLMGQCARSTSAVLGERHPHTKQSVEALEIMKRRCE